MNKRTDYKEPILAALETPKQIVLFMRKAARLMTEKTREFVRFVQKKAPVFASKASEVLKSMLQTFDAAKPHRTPKGLEEPNKPKGFRPNNAPDLKPV